MTDYLVILVKSNGPHRSEGKHICEVEDDPTVACAECGAERCVQYSQLVIDVGLRKIKQAISTLDAR